MTSAHFHAVIWIDHREARVFHFNPHEADKLVLHADNPNRHVHHHRAGADHVGLHEVRHSHCGDDDVRAAAMRGHIARAALEAVAYQTRDVLEAMERDSGVVGRMLAHASIDHRIAPIWETRPQDFPLALTERLDQRRRAVEEDTR